ncbi:MAG: hypothetical protein PHH54_01630 [Candidatus Nanoarchaeia archaeon]|nr:hypothetical protein [Candidatus Nanoarchaeia archaeon]MDD5740663.1 hypothetical protein [Candidatus Nanoarchaeia archaeon]
MVFDKGKIDLQKLLETTEDPQDCKHLNPEEIKPYLTRLQQRLSNLNTILSRNSQKETDNEFAIPFIKQIKDSLDCFALKYLVNGEDQIDFALSINTINCGFPTVANFSYLERDKQRAKDILDNQLSKREKIISKIRANIMEGQPILHEQILLQRHNYFSKVMSTNLLPSLSVNTKDPEYCGTKDGRRNYFIDWSCIEAGLNVPVFYRMWFTQDAKFNPLHDEKGKKKEKHQLLTYFIQESRRGIEDLREFVIHVDKKIDEIHPKQIRKYTVGPYYDKLTLNNSELENAFDNVNNASALRFTAEMVLSVDVTKMQRTLDYIAHFFTNKKIENEVYSDVKLMKYALIVPMRVKQKLKRGCDEHENPCEVYGVTESEEVTI